MAEPVVETSIIKKLFEAGVHFGHLRRRWHPKMAPYIHSFIGQRCIIDLGKTKASLEEVLPAITQLIGQRQQILFVGTKKQAQSILQKAAISVEMPYVVNRWVGGMLTNYSTISLQIRKLKDLEGRYNSGELANHYNKLEIQNFKKEIDNLNSLYGGCKEMTSLPGAIFVNDAIVNSIAVLEANRLGIPVIAMVDTNVDPSSINYPIFANDDAITSIQLITDLVVEAIKKGRNQVGASAEVQATKVEEKTNE